MNISKRLIILRERCGFTQNGLAERSGVSQSHLRRVELGQADITVGHLQLLCDAMSISIQEFFEEESEADEIAAAFSKLSPKQKTLLLTFLKSTTKPIPAFAQSPATQEPNAIPPLKNASVKTTLDAQLGISPIAQVIRGCKNLLLFINSTNAASPTE